ncbi:MAG: molybdopterin-guanine dinucleotide biosynthesis protein B [Pseudomonadota bacterium]
MKIFGLAGWSGSGKTTLIMRLIPALKARRIAVSTIKHAHHDFAVDVPGKDSYEHRAAGATEVMVSSANRWALMHELRGAAEPAVEDLLARMSPVDLVIIEGFKAHAHDKLEVHRPQVGKPLLCSGDPRIVAVASDAPLPGLGLPRFDLDDIETIAAFVIAHCGLVGAPLRVVSR